MALPPPLILLGTLTVTPRLVRPRLGPICFGFLAHLFEVLLEVLSNSLIGNGVVLQLAFDPGHDLDKVASGFKVLEALEHLHDSLLVFLALLPSLAS